ncbi:MAG: tetratricopeptide repeat protein [Spirochaetaceae bacterium]|jgi:tetratricopeptide (TPR) repeat protein|nr:tetratricopeptide repeat protein [Spirochaetaceae bacterium]
MKQRYFFLKHIPKLYIIFGTLLSFSCSSKEIDEDTLLVYVRAVSLYNEGKFKESILMLDGAEGGAKKTDGFVPALVLRGKAHYFSGASASAENDFRHALKIRPAHKEASLYLARILHGRGEKEAAMELVQSLLTDDPYDVIALRLASELTKDDPQGEAVSFSYLNRAVEAGSQSAAAFLERARINWINGRIEDALHDINAAKALVNAGSVLYRVIDNLEKTIKKGIPHEE